MAKEIALTKGAVSIVDDRDLEMLARFKWHLTGAGYAARSTRRPRKRMVYMHRVILAAHQGEEVDHVNGNKLDNRRSNLRLCTRAENTRNTPNLRRLGKSTSDFKGVSWFAARGKWQVHIRVEGRSVSLGLYRDEVEAAKRYDRAAIKHFGEFACLNFPEGL